MHLQQQRALDPEYRIKNIVQTGSEPQVLPTVYLAELMALSWDRPQNVYSFDTEKAAEALLQSPVIKDVRVETRGKDSVYVDYTVYKPVALLADSDNAAINAKGLVFPLTPYLSPKDLPEIFWGLQAPLSGWKKRVEGRKVDISFKLLHLLNTEEYREAFRVQRIDVSKAEAPSYGQREIVLTLIAQGVSENLLLLLRLSTRHYQQELANFLSLKEHYLDLGQENSGALIIDLRVPQIALVSPSS